MRRYQNGTDFFKPHACTHARMHSRIRLSTQICTVFFSNRGIKALFSAAVGCVVLQSGTDLFGRPGKASAASSAVEAVAEAPMSHDDLIGAIRESTQGL